MVGTEKMVVAAGPESGRSFNAKDLQCKHRRAHGTAVNQYFLERRTPSHRLCGTVAGAGKRGAGLVDHGATDGKWFSMRGWDKKVSPFHALHGA
jgi:hypothetical protein